MGRRARLRWTGLAVVALGLTACGLGEGTTSAGSPSAATGTPMASSSPPTASSPPPPSAAASPTGSSQPPAQLSRAMRAELDAQLRDAAWADDVERAAALIDRGADVNAKDDTQQSAYLIATSEGYLELLELTLANGARVDDKDSWNGTGLIRAAERGHAPVVGRLLQAGIERDHVNRIGYQAIHEAVWLGEDTAEYRDTVRVLIAGGVTLDRPSSREGLTPLEMARQRGYASLAEILRVAGDAAPIEDPDVALLRAARGGDADAAALAIRAGADLEARDDNDRTPLLLAAANDRVPVARLLVALGADPDALDDRHDTPWLVTGVTGSVRMLEALLPADPDLTIRNRFGGTALIPASERGHADYVARVLQTGIDVDHVNDLGWTALLEAVILGDGGPEHQQVVRLLLAAGADTTIPDRDGRTALDHARAKGYTEIVRLLADG